MIIKGVKLLAKCEGGSIESNLLSEHIRTCIINFDRLLDSIKSFYHDGKFYEEKFFEELLFSLLFHDIGKINYHFQKKMYKNFLNAQESVEIEETKLKEFFDVYSSDIEAEDLDHEIISVFFLDVLEKATENNEDYSKLLRKVKTIILFHHYNHFYSLNSKDDVESELNSLIESKRKYFNYLLSFYIKNFPDIMKGYLDVISSVDIINDLTKKLLVKFESFIKEILNAKLEYNFDINTVRVYDIYELGDESDKLYEFKLLLGFLMRIDYLSSFSQEYEVDIPPEIIPNRSIVEIIEGAIDKLKNKKKIREMWQEELIKNSEIKNVEKKICLVAPTGSGKTEFTFLIDDNRKLLYTLPFRVALNDMYDRFVEYFSKEYSGLLHSTNFIEFLSSKHGLKGIEILEKIAASRFLSYPFILSTADQILLLSLKFHGHERLLTTMPYAHVVIDEIQAYNTDMISILLNTIRILDRLDTKTTIVTATLPIFIRKKLEEMDFRIIDVWGEEYRSVHAKIKNLHLKRHKIKVVENYSIEEILKKMEELLDEIVTKIRPKRILVIFNRVVDAVKFYKNVENKYKGYETLLLHARMLESEKQKRIERIKNKKENEQAYILISTQVIEASVDIDADVLITEISTIDSLVQRFGRIYRNREEVNYDDDKPNCYVVVTIKNNKIIDRSRIYNPLVLAETLNQLKKIEGKILTSIEEKELVEDVYSKQEIVQHYEKEIQKFSEWMKHISCEHKSEAQRIFRNISTIEVCIWNKLSDITKKYLVGEILINKENTYQLFEIRNDIVANSISVPVFKFWRLSYWISNRMRSVKRFKNVVFIEVSEKELKEIEKYGIDGIDELLKSEAEGSEYIPSVI